MASISRILALNRQRQPRHRQLKPGASWQTSQIYAGLSKRNSGRPRPGPLPQMRQNMGKPRHRRPKTRPARPHWLNTSTPTRKTIREQSAAETFIDAEWSPDQRFAGTGVLAGLPSAIGRKIHTYQQPGCGNRCRTGRSGPCFRHPVARSASFPRPRIGRCRPSLRLTRRPCG